MVGRGLSLGKMVRTALGVLGVVCLVAAPTGGASAWDDDGRRGPPPRHREAPPPPERGREPPPQRPHWEPPPPRHWEPPPPRRHHTPRWEEGRWWRGHHQGRVGWWWIVGDRWVFFRVPVFPFPPPR